MGFGFSSSATFFFSSVTSDFAEERPDLSSLFVNRGGEGVNVAAQANDEGHRLARRFRVGARVGEEVRHDLLHQQLVDQHRQETARVLAEVLHEIFWRS